MRSGIELANKPWTAFSQNEDFSGVDMCYTGGSPASFTAVLYWKIPGYAKGQASQE